MSHPRIIVHEFGMRCYLRCVWRTMTARRPVTFLECAAVQIGSVSRHGLPRFEGTMCARVDARVQGSSAVGGLE